MPKPSVWLNTEVITSAQFRTATANANLRVPRRPRCRRRLLSAACVRLLHVRASSTVAQGVLAQTAQGRARSAAQRLPQTTGQGLHTLLHVDVPVPCIAGLTMQRGVHPVVESLHLAGVVEGELQQNVVVHLLPCRRSMAAQSQWGMRGVSCKRGAGSRSPVLEIVAFSSTNTSTAVQGMDASELPCVRLQSAVPRSARLSCAARTAGRACVLRCEQAFHVEHANLVALQESSDGIL